MNYLYILWGFLIVAGLGFLIGCILVLATKFFKVEEDPRIAEVEKLLPNYNCGACGKAGCHDMAEALVTGEEKKVSACKAGKKDKNYDPIIAYLTEHPDKDGSKHIPSI